MELHNFLDIFILYKKTLLTTILVVFACGAIVYILQPQTYKTTVLVNITRDTPRETEAYTYDHFYRLQADERFADTLVQWISSPIIHEQLTNAQRLDAKRLSSQVVQVTYLTDAPADAIGVSQKLITLLNAQSQKLNISQKEQYWFKVQGERPIVQDNTFSAGFIILLCATLGTFLGFWVVMIRHYMMGSR
jgi:uncharacterized protein involved in exopolysaccharide biosynthesis